MTKEQVVCFTLVILACASQIGSVQYTPFSKVSADLETALSDADLNTCAVFLPAVAAPWYTDVSVATKYWTNVTDGSVELIGENMGCDKQQDDGRLIIYPISTWEEAVELVGRKQACSLVSFTSAVGLPQTCMYRCSCAGSCPAMRVIRRPLGISQAEWKICDIGNLFYENLNCRFSPMGSFGGGPFDQRDAWLVNNRRTPTGMALRFGSYLGEYLSGIRVDYGANSYWFGFVDTPTYTISLTSNEVITDVITYHDADGVHNPYRTIVGITVKTNIGAVHGPYGFVTAYEYIFSGVELLYFHGRAGAIIDAIGVNFAC